MRGVRSLFVAAALVLGATAASAPTDPASVKPGTYKIEPTHTRALFSVDHFGVSTWYGDFTHVSGALKLDPANLARSHVEISVPTDSLSTTNAGLDDTLKGADWFDVAQFPTMTFKSTAVMQTGPDRADVTGDLTLRGVTRPIILHARFHGAAGPSPILESYMVGFEVRGTLKRSDFGIKKYPATISDDVELIVSAPFARTGD